MSAIEFLIPRRHTASYKGAKVGFWSTWNMQHLLARPDLYDDGARALESAGILIDKGGEPFWEPSYKFIEVDGMPYH